MKLEAKGVSTVQSAKYAMIVARCNGGILVYEKVDKDGNRHSHQHHSFECSKGSLARYLLREMKLSNKDMSKVSCYARSQVSFVLPKIFMTVEEHWRVYEFFAMSPTLRRVRAPQKSS